MANDVIQLITAFKCVTQFAELVQHYDSGGSGANPVSVAKACIDGFRANVEGTLLEMIAEDTEIVGYKAKRVNNGGGPQVGLSVTGAVGQVSSTSATSATAIVILNKFSNGTRWVNGKMFIPGLAESDLAGNTMAAGLFARALDFIAANAAFTQSPYSFTYGTWSRKPPTPQFYTAGLVAMSIKPGIQRRRLLPY